jgi:hypothetical protein
MTTTIDGTNITFVDGSAWNGTTGGVSPDTNTSRTTQSVNVGYLGLMNTVFVANTGGFYGAGTFYWGLNRSYSGASNYGGYVYPNLNQPYNDARLGSQSFFAYNNFSYQAMSGTWRARGQATSRGIYQNYGNFVLVERVA